MNICQGYRLIEYSLLMKMGIFKSSFDCPSKGIGFLFYSFSGKASFVTGGVYHITTAVSNKLLCKMQNQAATLSYRFKMKMQIWYFY